MNEKEISQILAEVPGVERRKIEQIISQVEANGADLCDDDIKALVKMTDQERADFLGMYQRN
jgi:hypothetical protein